MSPKAFAKAGLALVAIAAAACSETLAPKLERIQSQIANALGCDVTWTGAAGDGMWQTAGNWTTLSVPTGAQDVCITNDLPTTVIVRQDAFAKNITIGAPGNSTKQALALEGYFGFGARANLTVAEGIDNYGDLVMRGTGHFPAAPNLVATTIENRSGARIVASDVGFSGDITYWVNANVVNDGLMDLRYFMELRGQWTNRGVTQMAAGSSYVLNNGTWIQAGGSLDVQGSFELRDGSLRLEGGAMTGAIGPIRMRGSLEIANGSTSTGNVSLRDNVAMSGDVPAGLTVIIDGYRSSTTGPAVNTIVSAASAFRNNGTLRLIGSGHVFGTAAMLNVPGLIDNYGRIEVMPGPNDGSGRWIRASVHNRPGAVTDIATALEMDKAGATYVNEGTITIGPSRPVSITNGASFAQLGGAFTIGQDAPVLVNGGAFRFDGGGVTGQIPRLHETALSIAPTSTATGSLMLTGNTTLTGDVKSGQKLVVETIRPFSTAPSINATLTVAGNAVNHGTIRLWATGAGAGPAFITVAEGATLTNAAGARVEVLTDYDQGNYSNGRELRGNFVNEGTLDIRTWTAFAGGTVRTLAPAIVTGVGGTGILEVRPDATLIASGTFPIQVVNRGSLVIGAPGQPGVLNLLEYSGANTSSVTVEIGGSPTAPGVDFDRMTMTGPMTIGSGTLHVRARNGACVDGGKSYDIISFSHPSGDFAAYTGLDLGGGRTVQPQLLSNGYRLNVIGPVCPPPDDTPPVIAATVTGTQGNNSWYVSDVGITWSVTDAESAVSSTTGCDAASVTSDHAGVTFTCSATSAGGTATESVTIKRDATPPTWTQSRSSQPNANGWYNANVTVTLHGADAMSGLANLANVPHTVSVEGMGQGFSNGFVDNAGNSVLALVNDINLDKTAPVVTVTRSPLAGPDGWNNTDVTATWTATDALSGIDGSATATHLFNTDGANQSATRSFSDKAGNSASATISNINIDKTPTPPPPPPVLTPACSATPHEIWPANNKMVPVRVTVGGLHVTGYRLRSVTNNESGSADVAGWAIGTADLEGSVLAKRNGGGSGRTYTLTYDVFGANGATGSCTVTVRVPHDQRR